MIFFQGTHSENIAILDSYALEAKNDTGEEGALLVGFFLIIFIIFLGYISYFLFTKGYAFSVISYCTYNVLLHGSFIFNLFFSTN